MRTLHVGITKGWLLQQLDQYPVSDILPNFLGSKDEAVEAIRNDPREYFEDCDCDKELVDVTGISLAPQTVINLTDDLIRRDGEKV